MKIISDLLGTKLPEFKIKLASISSASLTAIRTYTLPDKDITIAGLSDILTTTLSGLSTNAGTLVSTDTIIQAFNKIAGLIDNDAWVSFTPSITGITLGNGTITGRYKKIGKTCHVSVVIVLGSTSVVTTSPSISLPFTAQSDNTTAFNGFNVYYRKSTGITYMGRCVNTVFCTLNLSTGQWADLTSTTPFTWGVGDKIYLGGTYEIL